MAIATAEKTIFTHDPTYGEITIKNEDRYTLTFRWPCTQEFRVSKAKLRLALKTLKELPKAPRGVKYLIEVPLYKSRYDAQEKDVTFKSAANNKVEIFSLYEGESTTLPIKDLEKALEL